MKAKHPDEHGLERYEIIDGVIYDMTQPPSERHQGMAAKDRKIKLRRYQRAGVREYCVYAHIG